MIVAEPSATLSLSVSTANMFAILAFAGTMGGTAKLAMAVLVITVTVYGVLAVKSALEDLKAMGDDALEELSGGKFGVYLKQIPIGMFIAISVVLFLAIGATQLLAIFSS